MHQRAIRSVRILEWVVLVVICVTWIAVMNSGTENGVGYYHQPDHDLLLPLIAGTVFNVATFGIVVFHLVPRYLARRRFSRFFQTLGLLAVSVLLLRTMSDKLIIAYGMADLADLSFISLALENSYSLVASVLLGTLYGIVRDWLFRASRMSEPGANANRSSDTVIQLKSGSTIHRLPIDSILFVKSEGNYMAFVSPEKTVLINMTMAEALDRLPNDDFVRIHRSYIVSIGHLDSVSPSHATVRNHSLPIGGKYRDDFLRRVNPE